MMLTQKQFGKLFEDGGAVTVYTRNDPVRLYSQLNACVEINWPAGNHTIQNAEKFLANFRKALAYARKEAKRLKL